MKMSGQTEISETHYYKVFSVFILVIIYCDVSKSGAQLIASLMIYLILNTQISEVIIMMTMTTTMMMIIRRKAQVQGVEIPPMIQYRILSLKVTVCFQVQGSIIVVLTANTVLTLFYRSFNLVH